MISDEASLPDTAELDEPGTRAVRVVEPASTAVEGRMVAVVSPAVMVAVGRMTFVDIGLPPEGVTPAMLKASEP